MKTLVTLVFVLLTANANGQCYVRNGQVICNISCSPSRGEIAVSTKKSTAELQNLLKQVSNNDILLKQALSHPSPEYRFVGVYAIAVKKLEKYEELMKLLEDTEPNVSLAARQALVLLTIKYGKREDFGPLPGATRQQITESIAEWKNWWTARRENLTKLK